MMRFEWDDQKALQNQRKHGVGFEEATSVFFDELATEFYDDGELGEDRFLLLGFSTRARLLLVCHCVREAGDVIRLISARKATKAESRHYGRES